MAFLDDGNESFLTDWLNIFFSALEEAPFLRLTVLAGQIGDDVRLAFKNPVFLREIEEAPGLSSYHTDVMGTELGPGSVAASLLDGLGELGVGHAVALAFDDGEGTGAGIVMEDDQIGGVLGRAVGDGDFDADAGGFISVAEDKLGPVFGADFFFGIGEAFGVMHGGISDALLGSFAGDSSVAVLYGLFEICHSLLLFLIS